MAIRDIFKINRKTFFNPSAWIDLEGLIQTNKTLFDVLKDLFVRPQPATTEEYEDALARQGLDDARAQVIGAQYKNYALGLFFLGLFFFGLGVALLFSPAVHWRTSLFLWMMSALLFAQAFRYDFWAMQIRKRKLGCRFADWKAQYWNSKSSH